MNNKATNDNAFINETDRRNGPGNTRQLVSPALGIFLIMATGFMIYSNTFHVPFIFDDLPTIIDNPFVKDLGNFIQPSALWRNRYVGELTFALDYRFHDLATTGYHVVNLCIHLITAVLVYLLVQLTFKTPCFAILPAGRTRFLSGIIPLFSSLFFVAHPLQTQAVTYIVQRFTSLATLFFVLSLLLYVKSRLTTHTPVRRTFYLASLAAAILAMKTKEISFTLPIIVVLYDVMFFRASLKKNAAALIPFLATMLIIPISMFSWVNPTHGSELVGSIDKATRAIGFTRMEYLVTQFRVLVTYLRLLVCPINQNLDYDYPTYTSLFDPPVLLSFLFLALLAGLAFYLLRSPRFCKTNPELRLVSFGIFWFFTTLSVESSIIPLGDVIFEHRLYLPSVGAFLAFISLLFFASDRLKNRVTLPSRTIVPLLVLMTVALAGTAYARNQVWQSGERLWEDVASKSPDKARPWNNLGYSFLSQTDPVQAFPVLQRALAIDPGYVEAWDNMGKALFQTNRPEEAEKCYRKALSINPDYQKSWLNLGLALELQGKLDEAVKCIKRAIELDPLDLNARLYLERTLEEMANT